MAPSRKNKKLTKKNTFDKKSTSSKNVNTPSKRHAKGKPSDCLGPQWTNEEIERFFKGYHRAGKDWEKVAAIVGDRTTGMVEALIAMNQGESDSDYEIKGAQEASKRRSKRRRGVEISGKNAVPSVSLDEGRHAFINKRRYVSKPWSVGKRTPRVPVSFLTNENEDNRPVVKRDLNINKDSVAQQVAVASQIGASPQQSLPQNEKMTPLPPINNDKHMQIESQEASAERRADNNDEADRPNMNKHKTVPRKDESMKIGLEEVKEACSGTEEGQSVSVDERKIHTRGIRIKSSKPSNKEIRRSKKVLFGKDDYTPFQALEALADISSRLPSTPGDTEHKLKETQVPSGAVKPTEQESSPPVALSTFSKDKCEADNRSPESRKRKQQYVCTDEKVTVESHSCVGKSNKGEKDGDSKGGESGKSLVRESSSLGAATPTIAAILAPKVRRRRKSSNPKPWSSTAPDCATENELLNQGKALANCLSWHKQRRWCTYEWLYSSIDAPWFAERILDEFLDYLKLIRVPKLTKVEWSVIRESIGKARRLSDYFLTKERKKLNQYRECVREHYFNLRSGNQQGLPAGIARPLSAGQRVIAVHPDTRELHSGCILTVDYSEFRVQFDHSELGVALVPDIDCMGLSAAEPASVVRQRLPPLKPAANEAQPRRATRNYIKSDERARCRKEGDVQALVELNRSLNKKEVVVALLARMNEEMMEKRDESGQLKKQYASVIVKLNEVNQQVASAITALRQRNTYRAVDSAAHLVNSVEASRARAQSMVGAAAGALPSLACPNVAQRVRDRLNSEEPYPDAPHLSLDHRLIANCVAAVFMIQTCTERQFPPSDVAQILGSAVSCLKPASSRNIPIYAEIQKYMGIIKNKIFALLPT